MTMKENRSGTSRRITLSAGAPASACRATQRLRVRPVGSPNQDASTPFLAAHRVLGFSHDSFSTWVGMSCW
ncbi:hypothetical protein [Streptomyces sp. NRRL B-2790]|uniref:hypothetical protein n=1 Tax=Streptomyces sp. NRRL B-2790 TaxID=1463835 RepID=UPI003567C7AB